MSSAANADPTTRPANQAASTIYLVSRSVDRLSEGRRLAASVVADTESDVSKALRGMHPDVMELTPPEGKDRIGIGQVRDIIRSAQFSPTQAASKACLIPNAERLTVEAANALLKILEEPPRGLQFILLAEHPSDLLPTIVSRSRLIRVPIASRTQIAVRLVAAGYEAGVAEWLARLALRSGELDRLLTSPVDIPQLLAGIAADVSNRDTLELIAACLGDNPILRRQGMLRVLRLVASRDADLLTVGVRMLSEQPRETLALLFHELLATAFDLVHSAHRSSPPADTLADQVRETFGVRRLHKFCFALDEAHRSLAVYGPIEGILVSLLLLSEGEDHGR